MFKERKIQVGRFKFDFTMTASMCIHIQKMLISAKMIHIG